MIDNDILSRLAHSTPREPAHDLYCRCFDAAQEISRLRIELESLRKNEYICLSCGLRKNDDHPKGDF